jgi:hypothetical protein
MVQVSYWSYRFYLTFCAALSGICTPKGVRSAKGERIKASLVDTELDVDHIRVGCVPEEL